MSLVLTDEQLKAVQSGQKNDSDLPTYFDANSRTEVPISRDFEAYLILTDDQLKLKANEWIEKAVELQTTNKDRDALAILASDQERLNAQAKMKALDEKLGNFEEFREQFRSNSNLTDVPEVQSFMFDLQRVVEELASNRDRAQFDDTISQVVRRSDDRLLVTDPQIEQLHSWTKVFSAYLKGQ